MIINIDNIIIRKASIPITIENSRAILSIRGLMQEKTENRAMAILRQIQSAASENDEPEVKIENILRIITIGFNADAAACYFSVDDNYLEMFGKYNIDDSCRN